jgi:hypothetical protein
MIEIPSNVRSRGDSSHEGGSRLCNNGSEMIGNQGSIALEYIGAISFGLTDPNLWIIELLMWSGVNGCG